MCSLFLCDLLWIIAIGEKISLWFFNDFFLTKDKNDIFLKIQKVEKWQFLKY